MFGLFTVVKTMPFVQPHMIPQLPSSQPARSQRRPSSAARPSARPTPRAAPKPAKRSGSLLAMHKTASLRCSPKKSALTLQKAWRGKQGRRSAEQTREHAEQKYNAATKLQQNYRGLAARRTFEQSKAASKLQRNFRGLAARRTVEQLIPFKNSCANQLQSAWVARQMREVELCAAALVTEVTRSGWQPSPATVAARILQLPVSPEAKVRVMTSIGERATEVRCHVSLSADQIASLHTDPSAAAVVQLLAMYLPHDPEAAAQTLHKWTAPLALKVGLLDQLRLPSLLRAEVLRALELYEELQGGTLAVRARFSDVWDAPRESLGREGFGKWSHRAIVTQELMNDIMDASSTEALALALAEFDDNNDGTIHVGRLRGVFTKLGCQHLSEASVDKLIRMVGAGPNGLVSCQGLIEILVQ